MARDPLQLDLNVKTIKVELRSCMYYPNYVLSRGTPSWLSNCLKCSL